MAFAASKFKRVEFWAKPNVFIVSPWPREMAKGNPGIATVELILIVSVPQESFV